MCLENAALIQSV